MGSRGRGPFNLTTVFHAGRIKVDTMSFVIEKDVAPVSGKRGRRPTAFPLDQMEVGDSFLIECDTDEKKTVDSWRRKLLTAKKRFTEQYDGKFSTAIVEGGLRVWRTE